MKDLKATVKKAVTSRIDATLNALKKEKCGDCIAFCKILQLKKPQLYKTVEDNWQNIFPNIHTTIDVNVTIRRVGEETLKINEGA